MSGKKTVVDKRVTWAQATRDIARAAMDRGVILPVTLAFIVLILVFKLDSEQSYEILTKIIDGLLKFYITGWVALTITLILWASHARSLRKLLSSDMERVGKEKSNLQAQLTKKAKLGSSNANNRG